MVYKTFKIKAKKHLLEGKTIEDKFARFVNIRKRAVETRRAVELNKMKNAIKKAKKEGEYKLVLITTIENAAQIVEGASQQKGVSKTIRNIEELNKAIEETRKKKKVILMETEKGKIVTF